MGQPAVIWRPQQFYTGEVSGSPNDSYEAVASEWKTARAVGDLNNLRTAPGPENVGTSVPINVARDPPEVMQDIQSAKTTVAEPELKKVTASSVPKSDSEERETSIWHSTLSEIKDLTRLMSLL
ncbi:hypothetical protein MMC11_001720 [Xylographa trunciseda]|nr:hypothetical protein [Xylographa trunciseda]